MKLTQTIGRQAGAMAAALLLLFGAPATAQSEPEKPGRIVMNESGGATQAANRKTFYNAFEKKYGIPVMTTSPVDLGKLRAMVNSGNIEWTVTEIAGPDAILAERSGLLEPLDLSVIDLSSFPDHLKD